MSRLFMEEWYGVSIILFGYKTHIMRAELENQIKFILLLV